MQRSKIRRTAWVVVATGALALAAAVPAAGQDQDEFIAGQNTIEDLCAWVATLDMAPEAEPGEEATVDASPAAYPGEETTVEEPPAAEPGDTTMDGQALVQVDGALLRELCDVAGMTADTDGAAAPDAADDSPLPTDVESPLPATESEDTDTTDE